MVLWDFGGTVQCRVHQAGEAARQSEPVKLPEPVGIDRSVESPRAPAAPQALDRFGDPRRRMVAHDLHRRALLQQPFVAPGRRRFFVDMFPAPDSAEAEGDQAFRAGDLSLAKAID